MLQPPLELVADLAAMQVTLPILGGGGGDVDIFREHGLGPELEDKTACDWKSRPWDHLVRVVDHRTLSGSKGRRHSIDKGRGRVVWHTCQPCPAHGDCPNSY